MVSTTRDILVFGNPVSGLGQGLKIAGSLVEALTAAGNRTRVHMEHPASVTDDMIPASADALAIAIGGDGTLRSVVDRLLQFGSSGRPLPQLLTVPLGTANLVANHLCCMWHSSRRTQEILHAISAQHVRKLDVGIANGRAMLAITGVGFDARVVHELAARRRGPITYADYLLPTMRSLAGYKFHRISVSVDGAELISGQPGIAFIGNIAEYGAGFSVTPTARSDDGLLDVCVLPCRSWKELFELGCICGTGSHMSHDRVIYRRGKHVQIDAAEPVPVQVDGDESGFTPVTIDLLPQQLTFIVPPQE